MVSLIDFQLRPLEDEERVWRSVIYGPVPSAQTAVQVMYSRRALHVNSEALFVELFGGARNAFWLDSSREMAGLSRFSFMGDARGADVLRYDSSEHRIDVERENGDVHGERLERGFFRYLRDRLRRYHVPGNALPFDFIGGFVGYFGYELKAECGGRAVHRSTQPDAGGLWVRRFLAADHSTEEIYTVAVCDGAEDANAATAWLSEMERRIEAITEPAPVRTGCDRSTVEVALEANAFAYRAAVERALEYINAGDTYEVCLTNRIDGVFQGEPLELYRLLRQINPAPFASFLRLNGLAVLCSSPERLLRIERGRNVQSPPIKGTARTGGSCAPLEIATCSLSRSRSARGAALTKQRIGKSRRSSRQAKRTDRK